MNKLFLNGSWNMKEASTDASFPVEVPGSVLSSLFHADAIEDPFDRMNEYQTRDLFWKDYEFSRDFQVTASILENENIELVCEGIDTLADIFINEKLAASVNNMHRTYRIPVKEFLTLGSNHIRVYFHSPLQFIEEYKYDENKKITYIPCGCMKGNQLIRKAHSMFGWDWGPQLIDAGIFRDIYLAAWSGSRIEDIMIHQEHFDHKVEVSVSVDCSLPTEKNKLGIRIFKENSGDDPAFYVIPADKKTAVFSIEDPELWWPNGYGEQPLYKIEIQLLDEEGNVLEEQEKIIGLRTLTISREKDQWGREFAFMVNGVKIFSMGGNYIPEDCIYSRITHERQEFLVKSMKRAHYNCVRIWGGGYYPSDYFYDLCDRNGLIIWQDLMYACNVYDVTDDFAKNCYLEAADNLKRLRHHASLGLICGNNEIESAWHHWDDFQTQSLNLRADYIKLFETVLPKAVKKYAPDVFFWPSSPSTEGCFNDPDNENNGDTHYWAVWHGQLPFTDYKNHFFRFCSEFGFQSFPALKTVETFAREEDQNIFSRVCESHQKNDAANGKMLYYLSENFRYPSNFSNLLYISQILQGMAMKYGVEHWRRHRGRCMGALYWQVNDDWPAPSWSSIDYFGRWKALHYLACDFFAPFTLSITTEGNHVLFYTENESMKDQKYTAALYLKDVNLNVISEVSVEGTIPALTSEKTIEWNLLDIPAYGDFNKKVVKAGNLDETLFLEGVLISEDGEVKRTVETLLPFKYMQLPKPSVSAEVTETAEGFDIALTTDAFAAFTELDFSDADVIFSDNYFHLTNKEPYHVFLAFEDIINGSFKDAADLKARLKIRTVGDTF